MTAAQPSRGSRVLAVLRPTSLRGRVVVGVVVLLAVLLAGLLITVDLILSSRLNSDLRTRLTDRVSLADQLDGSRSLSPQQLVDQLRGDGVAALLCPAQSSSQSGSGSGGNGITCVRADSGPPAEPPGGGGAPGQGRGAPPSGVPGKQPKPKTVDTSVQSAGSVLFVRTTLPSTKQVLTLSVDASQIGATLRRLVVLEVVGGLVALLIAALLLVRLVGTALRPLDHMTALAARIAAGDRGRRLGTGRPDTELGRTATAFDAMLDELESALAGASAAEARLRAFLSDVSHELRTPLTGLAATTETLLRDEPERDDRERAYVTLVRETRRANRLVEDLLTVTRLDTGMSLTTSRTDLVEVVGHEVERVRLLSPDVAIDITGVPHAPVDADAVRLGQVVANVLDNARTACGTAGRISVSVTRTERGWAVDVVDSGPGVPAADRERIFERLVRLDESRSRSRGGFGLGLPIARALARAHHGELECLPAPDGALFRLTLPAVHPHPAPDDRARHEAPVAATPEQRTGRD